MQAHMGGIGADLSIHNLGARKGWVISTTPRPLYHRESEPVLLLQEAGWSSGPVQTDTVNLTPTEFQFPDHPACSESSKRELKICCFRNCNWIPFECIS